MAYHPSQHYGETHFLRLGGAQGSLGVGKDTFARRVEPNLHRLALGNGNRLFPVSYIGGLVAYRETADAHTRKPMGRLALEYALTGDARERILQAEAELSGMVEARLTVTPSGSRFVSAAAIAELLGFNRATILADWAKRPELLPPAGSLADAAGVVDTYFTEAAFNDFITWVHPGQPNPIPLTAG